MNRYRDYCTLFAAVYGFNWDKAAVDLGYTRRTIIRWYEANSAPFVVIRYLSIVERGYLPDRGLFSQWRIEGDRIVTPYGSIQASEVEFLYQYKWAARQYERLARNKHSGVLDAQRNLREAIQQASAVLDTAIGITHQSPESYKFK